MQSFKPAGLCEPEGSGIRSGQELKIKPAGRGSSLAITQSSVEFVLDSSADLTVYSWTRLFFCKYISTVKVAFISKLQSHGAAPLSSDQIQIVPQRTRNC